MSSSEAPSEASPISCKRSHELVLKIKQLKRISEHVEQQHRYLWELCKLFICQHGDMTQELMAAVSVGADKKESVKQNRTTKKEKSRGR